MKKFFNSPLALGVSLCALSISAITFFAAYHYLKKEDEKRYNEFLKIAPNSLVTPDNNIGSYTFPFKDVGSAD